MAVQYRCKDGETLDWICWRHYGRQGGAVEAVLEENRVLKLADQGPHLPAGLVITLPDLPVVDDADVVRLWD